MPSSPFPEDRIIAHLDMDSFYASIEQKRHPHLRGRPVVIGADPKEGHGRGVVSTCSYEAREYGIRSAMPVSTAFRLCPQADFLPVDYTHYMEVSGKVMEVVRGYAGEIEQVSIDEAYLDLSGTGGFSAAESRAEEIRALVHSTTGLTCSVGIGPGRTIAKIASDFKKPDGLTVVLPGSVAAFLSPLPVRAIPGIGKKTEESLIKAGVTTAGDLAACDIQRLRALAGSGALSLQRTARGEYAGGGLQKREARKSLSREVTFPEDTRDAALLERTVHSLAGKVAETLSSEGATCRTITLRVRYTGFVTQQHSVTLSGSVSGADRIRSEAQRLLISVSFGAGVRLVGVRLSGISRRCRAQTTLRDFLGGKGRISGNEGCSLPEEPGPADACAVYAWE